MSRAEIGAEATMRDGAVLRADVYRPDEPGEYPVLLLRTPYGRTPGESESGYHHPSWFADHGYIAVTQDVRGRWGSDGEFVPFLNEAEDGYDTVEWAARLPGADGSVGMYGYSYPGLVQLLAATLRPPSLKAIAPGFTSSQAYDGWIYSHGAVFLGWAMTWALLLAHDTARRARDDELARSVRTAMLRVTEEYWTLPLDDLPVLRDDALPGYWRDWLEHNTYDDYWRRWSIDEDYGRITVPALHFTGWYDGFLRGTVDNYVGMTAVGNAEQRLMIWPWTHEPWAPVWGAEDSGLGFTSADDVHLAWFDRLLKGAAPAGAEAPVRVYMLHDGWRDFAAWPPPGGSAQELFLHSGGSANTRFGDGHLSAEPPGEERADVYTYDPDLPTWSAGGHSCCDEAATPMGPACQEAAEVTKSVLVYTSDVLDADLHLAGAAAVVLHAATTVPDTDWVARLCLVAPDGCSRNLQETLVRARYRNGFTDPEPLAPGEVVEYRLDLGPVGVRVPSGYRLRLDIASSDFPQWDRNLNSGGPVGREGASAARVAVQTVFHDAARPSRLLLPVVDPG
jgi:putative CocE/NonD family hydrolase